MLAVASARSIPTLGAETRKEHVERSSNGASSLEQMQRYGFKLDGNSILMVLMHWA